MIQRVVFDQRQHYDHCWLKYDKEYWFITRISQGFFYLTNERQWMVGDFSRVNWAEYSIKTAEMIAERLRDEQHAKDGQRAEDGQTQGP